MPATSLTYASACSKLLGIEDFSLAPDAGAPDAPQFCYGASLIRACLPRSRSMSE